MSETSEDFAALKEHLKEKRKEREAANSQIIWDWCDVNDAEYLELQPWHIRVVKDGTTIDIFPQSKKYHNVTKNNRGYIKGQIPNFLNSVLIKN